MNLRLALTTILMLLAMSSSAMASDNVVSQIETQVRQDLQQHVATQAANYGRRIEFEISRIDPRLNLPLCSKNPSTDFDRTSTQSRLSVKVVCDGQQPWSIYVPVQIQSWQKVVIVRNGLARGQKISQGDVILADAELSSLRYGFLTHTQEAIGLQSKRNLSAGDVLSPNMLDAPEVVAKGDEVMIVARGQAMSIQVPGTAMSDGRIGEQISVRNASSQRIIRATVVQEGIVEVQI